MAAKLIFNYGTVSSGKTVHLLNMCFNYESAGWKVITIKPALDTRSELIETRSHIPPRKADITLQIEDSIYDYSDIINTADVILVDECQFLSESQVDELRNFSVNRDIDVICFGLRTDSFIHLFPASKRLLELADEIAEVKTICQVCGKHASFSKRVTPDVSGGVVDPGWDNYKAVCFKCYTRD